MVSILTACAFCGREHDPVSRFCIDCGKPVSVSEARPAPSHHPHSFPPTTADTMGEPSSSSPASLPTPGSCPRCARAVEAGLAFCGHCGTRVAADPRSPRITGPRVALLDDTGAVSAWFTLERGDAVVGRGDADIRLDDIYLSPLHARLELREGELWVRDLGSRNGTWTFIEEPTRLCDGDVMLVGSQLIRFRRLGYPGPRPPEADSTRRMGSLTPSADVAVLEQLRADASVRDCFHLSPARNVLLGRESGDWVFPYDQTMSGRHAEIRSQDADFFVHDDGSRNGVALAVRGERAVRQGQRVLVGDQILRIESITT